MFKSNFTEKQKINLKINENGTIRDSLIKINSNLQKCLIVVNKKMS